MNPSPTPRVDVVILTWNDGALLAKAVDSVLASTGVTTEVFIIDNASEPPAVTYESSRIHLVRNPENRGIARGRNQGIALTSAPFVCLLDSDAELHPQSLRLLLEPFSDQTVGVTVPVFANQLPESSAGRAPSISVKVARSLNLRDTYANVPRDPWARYWDVDFGIGACQVIRREVFERVGGLDEAVHFGPEDVDFCLRAISAGYRIIQVDDARVLHPPRRAFRNPFSRRGLKHAASLIRHFRRHPTTVLGLRHRSRAGWGVARNFK